MYKFSCVISIKNGEEFIEQCLSSLPTINDLEYIFVDNGSYDLTISILLQSDFYKRNNANIRILNGQQLPSLAAALNYGISESTAEWIVRMDIDDIWLPSRTELLNRIHQGLHSGSEFIYGSAILIDDLNRKICIKTAAEWWFTKLMLSAFGRNKIISHPATMFKRKVFVMCGGYHEVGKGFGQDKVLWKKFISVNVKTEREKIPIICYRHSMKGVTGKRFGKQKIVSKEDLNKENFKESIRNFNMMAAFKWLLQICRFSS
ncbi:glycosyltransferase family 2 protein [Shewanella sp.]|uniref:glycosyltransferase family 2 protein n=1 Tax=Shewanella sp. TaxID=50422 RepID=UPI0040471386